MFIRLVLLFTLVPVLEIYVIIKVGQLVGAGAAIALILLTGIAGAYLARTQGFDIIRRIQADMEQGKIPADSLIDGAMVLAGGLLLLTPGFCTDLFGFCLLVPVTRDGIKKVLIKYIQKKIERGEIRIHRL